MTIINKHVGMDYTVTNTNTGTAPESIKPASTRKGISVARWTPKESKVVRQQVKRKDIDLSAAFDEAAKLLPNRTRMSISGHYYDKIKKPAVKKVIKKRKPTVRVSKEDITTNKIDNLHTGNPIQISLAREVLNELVAGLSRADKKYLIMTCLKD